MSNDTKSTFIAFHEVFDRAALRGHDRTTIAEAMRRTLQSSLGHEQAVGVRRTWLPADIGDGWSPLDGWREVSVDTKVLTVPSILWEMFDSVLRDCDSVWIDDVEDPEESASADWFAGFVETRLYCFDGGSGGEDDWLARPRVQWSNLRISPSLVEVILDDPHGVATDLQPAVNDNPFSDKERRDWIASRGQHGGADIAYNEYRRHPRYDGTKQAGFRSDWRATLKPSRGRPVKASR